MLSEHSSRWAKALTNFFSTKCASMGNNLFLYSVDEEESSETFVSFNVEVQGTGHSTTLNIPVPNQHNLVSIHKGDYVILPRITGHYSETEFPTKVILPFITYTQELHNLWKKFASRLSRHNQFEPQIISRGIEAFFTNGPYVRAIESYHRPAMKDSLKKMVLMENLGDDIEALIPKCFDGYIDPNSTPTTDKVGTVYLLASGAQIKDQTLIKGEDTLSDLYRRNTIFPTCSPNQLYKGRSPIKTHLVPYEPEHPLIVNEHYQEELSGKNLRTALICHPLNNLDAIVISDSAANKLRSWHTRPYSVVSNTKPQIHVKQGDTYNPKLDICTVMEEGEEVGKRPNFYRPNEHVIVDEVRVTEVVNMNTKVYKTRFLLRSLESCMDGDKIITRHGAKGVVRIVPDEDMPHYKEEPLEVLVNPVSVLARKNFGMLAEMSYGRMLLDQGETSLVIPQYEKPDWDNLVNLGYGKVNLDYMLGKSAVGAPNFMTYKEPTMIGPVFWLRTDSIARNRMKASSPELSVEDGTKRPDSTSFGTRFDLTTNTILWGVGLADLYTDMEFNSRDYVAKQHYADNVAMLTTSFAETPVF